MICDGKAIDLNSLVTVTKKVFGVMENHVIYKERTTAAELKKAAKLAGIKRYSSMTKNELLEALNESGSE